MIKNIGIIGYGNMGSAIAERVKTIYTVFIFDKDKGKNKYLRDITVADSNVDLVGKTEAVILAVKPQDFSLLLPEIKSEIKDKLIISIAAGIPVAYLEKYLGADCRIIRAMPNLPAKIGKGMICLCKGNAATQDDLSFAQGLFSRLGKAMVLDESLMDAVTAISGSGPGYLYYLARDKDFAQIRIYAQAVFLPELIKAACGLGFTEEQAKILAETTVAGSLAFLERAGLSLAELTKLVASKGGTTEAALNVLQKKGSLEAAVKAAKIRAEELSRRD